MAERKHNEESLHAAPARQATVRESPHASAAVAHPAALLRDAGRGPLAPSHVLQLQRAAGNRATARLLGGKNSPRVQTKLVVAPADDPFELEADLVARDVVAELAAPTAAGASPPVQRLAEDEGKREGRVRRKFDAPHAEIDADGGTLPPDVERQLEHGRGGGRPLDEGLRARLEQSFGADFGGVRVHTGERAEALNASLGARAFTTGQDIFFGPGEYAPDTRAGREVLAHELTHVVQQNPAVAVGRESGRAGLPPISAVAAGGQRLQLLRRGTAVMSDDNREKALADLKKIKKASDVGEALEELDISEPNVLKRYKNEYKSVYLERMKDGDIFQWPLTYLLGRSARKRGKSTEDYIIPQVYRGETKNNKLFFVQQWDDQGDIEEDDFEARIPDVFSYDVVADVKNVKKLSFDQQLQDFYIIAKQKDYISGRPRKVYKSDKKTLITKERDFEVVVRSSDHPEGRTDVSGTLMAAADRIRYLID